jgi:hypothetical protein
MTHLDRSGGGWLILTAALAGTAIMDDAAPGVDTAENVRFEEQQGQITLEAERFVRQTGTEQRAWHIVSGESPAQVTPDGDPPHLEDASGSGYIEVLPDTRRSHDDKLIPGENFSPAPGKIAVLHYPIRVHTPGRYYVWARTYSTTTEDNGLHFGLDGEWPESGQRWQTVNKHGWHWDCKQRTTEVHTGVPMQLWLDIDTPGDHELLLSMREDGAEVDQIVLARSADFRPPGVKYPGDRSPEALEPGSRD